MRLTFKLFKILLLIVFTENIIFGQFAIEKKDTTVIKRITISGKNSEYSPFLYQNKLYYTSDKLLNIAVLNWDQEGGNTTNLWSADKIDSITFKNETSLKNINTKLNETSLSICNNNGYYYISNGASKNGSSNISNKVLFMPANFNENATQLQFELDFDTISIVQQHVIGDTLIYFTGIVKNGKTGADLYTCAKKGSSWSRPEKLNNLINTSADECFPHFFNGKLYYSSNNDKGKGKLDLYVYYNDTVIPLTHLNSTEDDFALFMEDESKGYFSSNKLGTDDIFYFARIIKPNFDICKPIIYNTYCYEFKEKTDYDNRDTLNMTYEWDFGDGSKARGLTVKHCLTQGEGIYTIKLNAIQKESEKDFYTELEYEFDLKNERQMYISSFDTLATDSVNIFESSYSNIENFEIEKYFWDTGDGSFYEGPTLKYSFKTEGTHIIKLLAFGKLEGKKTYKGVYKHITIMKLHTNYNHEIKNPKYKKSQ